MIKFWLKKNCYGFRNLERIGCSLVIEIQKFFHTQTIIRRRRNKIHGLFLDDGLWCTDEDRLRMEAQQFFQNLFSKNCMVDVSACSQIIMPRIGEGAIANLQAPVLADEVRVAIMSMKPYKAPGPDGFQPVFFKTYWQVVGQDVCALVQ